MPRRWKMGEQAALLVVAAAASACGLKDTLDAKSCTEIGCSDGLALRVQTEDGSLQTFQIVVLIGGQAVTCERPTATELPIEQRCDDPSVSISHEHSVVCTETRTGDAVSQSCVPNGKFTQTIHVQGTPPEVAVSLGDASGSTYPRTFPVQYLAIAPNGPECEPTCQRSIIDWVLQ